MISLIDLITLSLASSRMGSICAQPSDFRLDRNLLYSEICSAKGVCNNREFVIPMFVICVNAYNGKNML